MAFEKYAFRNDFKEKRMSERKIGLIGLDTTHAIAFTQLLNDPHEKYYIPWAGKVTCAYPGVSDDLEVSYSRVEGFTKEIRENYGVEILDSPEAVAENCDIVIITAVDGRVHRELFERIVKFGRPTFIDKPFACDLEDVKAIVKLADESAVPVMSCSSLRYAENFHAVLTEKGKDDLASCDVFGPMEFQHPINGFFWYGCHCVEMVVAAMGLGCKSVSVFENDNNSQIVMSWIDGRMATIHGMRKGHTDFGFTFHYKSDVIFLNVSKVEKPYYATMLEAMFHSLSEGRSDVPADEMIEVVRIIEAANKARGNGEVVLIKE